jgi:hypothetical protein
VRRNDRHSRLLRACSERPGRGAANECDEIASSHSITSSAAAKKAFGTFMSSALAVVRLMPRLNRHFAESRRDVIFVAV